MFGTQPLFSNEKKFSSSKGLTFPNQKSKDHPGELSGPHSYFEEICDIQISSHML